MKPRPLIYSAARAVPIYPRRDAMFCLLVVAAAVAASRTGPPGAVLVFVPAFLVLLAVAVMRAGSQWEAARRAVPILALAVLCLLAALRLTTAALLLCGLVGWLVVTGWWLWREVLPAQGTRRFVERRADRDQRKGGVASWLDVMENASPGPIRRRAHRYRPSLAAVPKRKRSRLAAGVLIAQTGLGLRWGQQVWTTIEESTLTIGAPRTGKSLSLAKWGETATGAVITVSTKLDLAQNVHQVRRSWPKGSERPSGSERAVHIFNPGDVGGVASTVRWRVLMDCENYMTAARRAADMLPKAGTAETEEWEKRGRRALPLFLHAGALDHGSIGDVQRWISLAAVDSSLGQVRDELSDVFGRFDDGEAKIRQLNGFLSSNARSRSSVTMMMLDALAWCADPVARDIGDAPDDTTTLDVQSFIRNGETLHILGRSDMNDGGYLTPLLSAVIGEIMYQIRMTASRKPDGRLDPPLTFLVDEAGVSIRLPLPQWSADMGGIGVTLHVCAQSTSQLIDCWGFAGYGSLLDNIGTFILYGGGKNVDELRKQSELTGIFWRESVNRNTEFNRKLPGTQRGELSETAVLSPSQIANMPFGKAVVVQRGLGGVFIGHPPQVNERRSHRKLPLVAEVVELHEAVEELEWTPAPENVDHDRELA